jgi:hypothetical protein
MILESGCVQYRIFKQLKGGEIENYGPGKFSTTRISISSQLKDRSEAQVAYYLYKTQSPSQNPPGL